ncbi:hypothetical protein INR49_027409 [Caranx melampygus]|nr:hypothetical protein INR49_027409 [Caranx melampygus]
MSNVLICMMIRMKPSELTPFSIVFIHSLRGGKPHLLNSGRATELLHEEGGQQGTRQDEKDKWRKDTGFANYLGLSSQLGSICTARHAGQAEASLRTGTYYSQQSRAAARLRDGSGCLGPHISAHEPELFG